MLGLGPTEMIIILVLVIIIFGAGKLPEIGGALGRGIKEFRATIREDPVVADEAEPKRESKSNA